MVSPHIKVEHVETDGSSVSILVDGSIVLVFAMNKKNNIECVSKWNYSGGELTPIERRLFTQAKYRARAIILNYQERIRAQLAQEESQLSLSFEAL